MTEKVRKVFDILGVEPEEEFKFDYPESCTYKLTKELQLYYYDDSDDEYKFAIKDIRGILCGKYNIVKLKQWTKEEKLIAKYWKLCGYDWIAKDSNGTITAFRDKPLKTKLYLVHSDDNDGQFINIDMPNIHWEDGEPTFIDDILKE